MTKFRTLALASLALGAAGPAFAAATAVTIYDAPQQQDAFFQMQTGNAADVAVTGSLGVPATTGALSASTGAMPFWAAHERIRVNAQDNN